MVHAHSQPWSSCPIQHFFFHSFLCYFGLWDAIFQMNSATLLEPLTWARLWAGLGTKDKTLPPSLRNCQVGAGFKVESSGAQGTSLCNTWRYNLYIGGCRHVRSALMDFYIHKPCVTTTQMKMQNILSPRGPLLLLLITSPSKDNLLWPPSPRFCLFLNIWSTCILRKHLQCYNFASRK